MPQIFQAGTVNLSALVLPDLYVQILSPAVSQLNGVPTNILGIVGAASWGPVNSAYQVGNATQLQNAFGLPGNRKYDLVTHASVCIQNGANNMQLVRITDGTDTAAAATVLDTASAVGAHLTMIWTGTYGNNAQYLLTAGSSASTFKLTIAQLGYQPEVYDNIPGTGSAFWTNLVNAVNNGNSALRGPSKLVVATIGTSSAAPAITSAGVSFASGTDGATTITGTVLVGTDGAIGSRTGMYALRRKGCSVAFLADCDTSTTWTTQLSYGNSEGTYMIMTGPAGQTPTTAATALATAGIAGPNAYNAKLMLGDWCYWQDQTNNVLRLISPQPFQAGLLVNLAPQASSLNQQVYGLVGTQTSLANQQYSTADLTTLAQNGIEALVNPSVGGNYFSPRLGRNLATNAAINGDNYTRMTNYLAATVAAGMGRFVGGTNLQTTAANDPYRQNLRSTVDAFLSNMLPPVATPPQIAAFQTICDLTNNSPSSIAAGNCVLQANVTYLSVVTNLIINIQGGQTVVVQSLNSTPISQAA